MAKKKLSYFLIVVLVIGLSGCWDINEINKTNFPMLITLDTVEHKPDIYLVSIQYPVLDPEAPEKVKNIASEDYSLQAALENLQARTMRWVSLGMLQVMVFSEDVAKKGIQQFIDTIWRNPLVPGSILLAITSDKAKKINEVKVGSTDNMGTYLRQLFETSAKNTLVPNITLNQFFIAFKTKGQEPYIPIIKYGTNDIKISGVAVFKGEKMVGKLKLPETRALLLLLKENIHGGLALKIDNYMVTYYIQNVKSKMEPVKRGDRFEINIELNIKADILENTSPENLIDNNEMLAKMEYELASALKIEINHLFDELQKLESDILGIGKSARVKYPQLFGKEDWNKEFSKADIKVTVKAKVSRFAIAI